MKKVAISMLGVLAIVGLLALLTSCKKECTCTEKEIGSTQTYTEKVFPENYNAKNCSELATMLSGDGYSVKCN